MPDLDELLSPGYFTNAVTAYDEATRTWRYASQAAIDRRADLAERRDAAKAFEAEAISNGYAVGSNDKARDAALKVYLESEEGWRENQAAIRRLEGQIATAEIEAERATMDQRILRARLEWVTAKINAQGARNA